MSDRKTEALNPSSDSATISFENQKTTNSHIKWRLIFFVLSMAVLSSAAFTLPLWQPRVSVALLKILLPVLGAIVFGAVAWLKYHVFQERVKLPSELPKSFQVLLVLSGIFSMVGIVAIAAIAASTWLVTVLSISTISVISLACLSIAMLLPEIALWIHAIKAPLRDSALGHQTSLAGIVANEEIPKGVISDSNSNSNSDTKNSSSLAREEKNSRPGVTIENGMLVRVEDSAIANGHFIIPNSVTRIGDSAFSGCKSLGSVPKVYSDRKI